MVQIELMVNDNLGKFQYKTEASPSRVPCIDEHIEFFDHENKKKCAKVISVFHLATKDPVVARVFVNLVGSLVK